MIPCQILGFVVVVRIRISYFGLRLPTITTMSLLQGLRVIAIIPILLLGIAVRLTNHYTILSSGYLPYFSYYKLRNFFRKPYPPFKRKDTRSTRYHRRLGSRRWWAQRETATDTWCHRLTSEELAASTASKQTVDLLLIQTKYWHRNVQIVAYTNSTLDQTLSGTCKY